MLSVDITAEIDPFGAANNPDLAGKVLGVAITIVNNGADAISLGGLSFSIKPAFIVRGGWWCLRRRV